MVRFKPPSSGFCLFAGGAYEILQGMPITDDWRRGQASRPESREAAGVSWVYAHELLRDSFVDGTDLQEVHENLDPETDFSLDQKWRRT
jgi:hypothetical protein